MVTPMELHAIPAFSDNYLWLLTEGQDAVVVDPGDARPVQAFLDANGLNLKAILVTHHHPDHVGGLAPLLACTPVPVYGPAQEASRIPLLDHPLDDGDVIEVLGRQLQVLSVPGHTAGHIAYYCKDPGDSERGATAPLLLCGDTLFSAGCGRLFEGTPEQMHRSLARLAALPPATRVYCTHEYTLANLAFARAVEPDNSDVTTAIDQVLRLRADNHPSLPSTLAHERRINPFLRADLDSVRSSAEHWAGQPLNDEIAVFTTLRRWKDGFRAAP